MHLQEIRRGGQCWRVPPLYSHSPESCCTVALTFLISCASTSSEIGGCAISKTSPATVSTVNHSRSSTRVPMTCAFSSSRLHAGGEANQILHGESRHRRAQLKAHIADLPVQCPPIELLDEIAPRALDSHALGFIIAARAPPSPDSRMGLSNSSASTRTSRCLRSDRIGSCS